MNKRMPRTPFSTALSGSAKETEIRLKNIFSGPKRRPPVLFLALVFSMCIFCGDLVVFQSQAAELDSPAVSMASGLTPALKNYFNALTTTLQKHTKSSAVNLSETKAEHYYEAGSLPLFQIAFSRMSEAEQGAWLERIYADGEISFFSIGISQLRSDSPLLSDLAEKIYNGGNIAFFSVLTGKMDKDTLEGWLDRALEDDNWSFQSMLFKALERDEEFDELADKKEKEWAEAQLAEYRAVGVTMDGKDYYYQGQLVNIFLDVRPNKSFYTLNTNPKGTVNIKITRDANNEITGVAYITESEVSEFLDERRAEAEEEKEDLKAALKEAWRAEHKDEQKAVGTQANRNVSEIPVQLETVADGEIVWLGKYSLSEGDRIRYNVSAETGNGLQIGFANPGDENLSTTYYAVRNLRKNGGELKCNADMTFRSPAKPGTYALFLRATDGALGKVTGSISITAAEP